MAGYLFLYREGDKEKFQPSPEEMQSYMQSWMDWIGQAMEAGWMTVPGDALKEEGRVLHADKSVTDGPFAESKEVIGGYSIVEAENFDQAVQYAHGCPIFAEGGTVEVRELADVKIEQPQS